MLVPQFKQFLNEDKNEKDFLRLLIITDEPEQAKTFHTADRLKEECDKLKYPYYLFKLLMCSTDFSNVSISHLAPDLLSNSSRNLL